MSGVLRSASPRRRTRRAVRVVSSARCGMRAGPPMSGSPRGAGNLIAPADPALRTGRGSRRVLHAAGQRVGGAIAVLYKADQRVPQLAVAPLRDGVALEPPGDVVAVNEVADVDAGCDRPHEPGMRRVLIDA